MKAWICYDDEFAYPFHAPTRGAARVAWASEYGDGYGSYAFRETIEHGLRIKRAPEFDDVDRFDHYELLRLGYYKRAACSECETMTAIDGSGSPDEYVSVAVGFDGDVYCAECAVRVIKKEMSYGS